MSDSPTLPDPETLSRTVFDELADKAGLPLLPMLVLGVLAGVYIGLGGMFALVALAGAEALPHGFAQVLAGSVFALGLILVLVAGAELFTGNTLMAGPVWMGQVRPTQAGRALAIVYCANFAGGLTLAFLALAAGLHEAGDGALGRAARDLAETKTAPGALQLAASGVLANMLVCLAVWLAFAGKTVVDKLAGLLLPIAAFVAAGLEHSVANMFLLPFGYLVQLVEGGGVVTFAAMAKNLAAATIGNLIGGAAVALAYAAAYRPAPDKD